MNPKDTEFYRRAAAGAEKAEAGPLAEGGAEEGGDDLIEKYIKEIKAIVDKWEAKYGGRD